MNRSLFPLLLVVLFYVENSQAQTIWSQRTDAIGVKLEFLSPNFPNSYPGYDFTSKTLTLNGRYPIGEFVVVLLETPMTWENSTSPYSSTSKNGLGNLFVGIEIGSMDSPIYGELGARPILRQELGASGIGAYYGDFDRGEAYIKEFTSYQLALNIVSTRREGFVYRIRLGPTICVPEQGKKSTTFVDYGAKAGFDNGALSLYTGLTGRWNTEEERGKTAFHHLGFDFGYRISGIRPAIFFRLPLDKELSDLMDRTIGASVAVEL